MFAKIANGELILNQILSECNSVKTKYLCYFFHIKYKCCNIVLVFVADVARKYDKSTHHIDTVSLTSLVVRSTFAKYV